MTDAAVAMATPTRAATDKRGAILAAALGLIARLGLHNAPMSAVAREAGVAAGTLYLYFPSKEAMINALYLELLEDRDRSMTAGMAPGAQVPSTGREALWGFWYGLARWHLDNPEGSSFLQQCKPSAILTENTREVERRQHASGLEQFERAVRAGFLRDIPLHVFWALVAGPVDQLTRMHESRELEITDAVLQATFDGVCRSVLPESDVNPRG